MQRAVDGVTHVVHSAAMVHCGWRHLAEMRHVNVEGARVVARAARRAGARLIHVSSVDAIGLRSDGVPADEETSPGGMLECPYVVTKRQAEEAVLEEVEKGLDAVIVNPVYMIGPWDWKPSSGRMLLEVGAGRGLFAPPGSNDFVDVRDVAQGILAAMSRGRTGRRYILGGQPLSYLDAWRIFARVSGWCGDLVSLLTRRELPVNSAATGMSMLPHNFSCARAEAELGYTRRPFEAAAQDAWDWFVGHGYVKALRPGTALAR
jgi:dihydroflavonol-4-reductase